MKPGDYVICLKHYELFKDIFIVGNLYKIKNIEKDGYTSIYAESDFSYGFELYEKKSNRYFHDFFITPQKIRKLKIEKINEKMSINK